MSKNEVHDQSESDLPLEIGRPARGALLEAGYRQLGQLTALSEAELLRLHGVGPKAVGLLRKALNAKGLSFAEGRKKTKGQKGTKAMANREPVAEKLPSNADHATPTPWAEVRAPLAEGTWYWLATVRPDGRPHVRPVLAVWLNGTLHFCSNESTRKAKNLAHDSHCAITLGTDSVHLVVEGTAVKVRDEAKLKRAAEVYASKYDWHVTVRDGAFYADYGAPTAGPSPYELYEITPTTAFGFGTEEKFSPTRWRF